MEGRTGSVEQPTAAVSGLAMRGRWRRPAERRSTMAATLKLTHKTIGVEVRRGTVRRRGRRRACRVSRIERHDRDTGRTWTSHPAGPQWPKLQPNSDLRRRRGRHCCLPMRREEASADLSRVLRCSQPGTLAQTRVGAARDQGHRTNRRRLATNRASWSRVPLARDPTRAGPKAPKRTRGLRAAPMSDSATNARPGGRRGPAPLNRANAWRVRTNRSMW